MILSFKLIKFTFGKIYLFIAPLADLLCFEGKRAIPYLLSSL